MKPLISMRKKVQAGNVVVLDEKNPHIRNNRDGTVVKLDVNNGVCTVDMWVCLDEADPVFQLARTLSGSSVTNKPARPGMCSSGGEESHALQVWNGLEEGEDAMTDEEGEGVAREGEQEQRTGECEQAQETNRLQGKEKNTKQHACRSAIGAHTACEQRSHSSPRCEEKE